MDEPNVNSELLTANPASGSVGARLMANNFQPEALRTNALLTRDEWKVYDDAIIRVTQENLRGVADLLNAGLTYQLTNGLGVTSLHWERSGDINGAESNMSGMSDSANDRITFDEVNMPIPVTYKDWHLNLRTLHATRQNRSSLDTTIAELAAIKVNQFHENVLFNGQKVGSNSQIYGYRNFPHRATGTFAKGWEDPTKTGDEFVTDIMSMQDPLIALQYEGPFVYYVSYKAYQNMGRDYKANGDKTILQRLMEIPGVGSIRPSRRVRDDVAADASKGITATKSEVIMLQMTRDVIDMVVGMQPTTLQWEEHGGLQTRFKIMGIMVPRIKSDMNNRCGLVHFLKA